METRWWRGAWGIGKMVLLHACVIHSTSDPVVDDCGPGSCGPNAHCEADGCICDPGFTSVCHHDGCLDNSLVCDGVVDCSDGADEDAALCEQVVIQQWQLVDGCDDGRDMQWRLWSQDADWAWPGNDEVFVTSGYQALSYENIECYPGELICFGGASGSLAWGVGLDNATDCDDCCYSCADDLVDLGIYLCP